MLCSLLTIKRRYNLEPSNRILEEWNNQSAVFIHNLQLLRSKYLKKTVHDLRVSVKKIRSYLRLKTKIDGKEWKDQFKNTVHLFKSYGKVRDFDVSLTLLRKLKQGSQITFPPLRKYFLTNRLLVKKWATENLADFDEKEIVVLHAPVHNTFAALADEEIFKIIIKEAYEKLKKVKILARHFERNIHAIRKLLKDIYYWLSVYPEKSAENNFNLKDLDKLNRQLGNWQDHYILSEKIKYFKSEYLLKGSRKHNELIELEGIICQRQAELTKKAKESWLKFME